MYQGYFFHFLGSSWSKISGIEWYWVSFGKLFCSQTRQHVPGGTARNLRCWLSTSSSTVEMTGANLKPAQQKNNRRVQNKYSTNFHVFILIYNKEMSKKINKWEFNNGHSTRWLFLSSVSRLNWNLECQKYSCLVMCALNLSAHF